MPAPTPEHVVGQVKALVETGWSNEDIVKATKAQLRTVQRIRANLDKFGTPRPPQLKKIGRPRLIPQYGEEKLVEYLREKPNAYLDEMAQFLLEACGITASASSIHQCLKKLQWTRREVPSAQPSRVPLTSCAAKPAEWVEGQLGPADGSTSPESDWRRNYGWFPPTSAPEPGGWMSGNVPEQQKYPDPCSINAARMPYRTARNGEDSAIDPALRPLVR